MCCVMLCYVMFVLYCCHYHCHRHHHCYCCYLCYRITASKINKNTITIIPLPLSFSYLVTDLPTFLQIEVYTRVLMGHIDLASAVFPAGTSGLALDALARRHLWRIGLDYPHGEGGGGGGEERRRGCDLCVYVRVYAYESVQGTGIVDDTCVYNKIMTK